LRKDQLCSGEETCPYSECECCGCGHVWKPDDPKFVSVCPECKHDFHEKLRCIHPNKEGGCPLTLLENSIDINPDTSVLGDAKEIQDQIALDLNVSIDQIEADTWRVLLILKEEQDRLQKENTKT
jgi:hypothetical protein